MVNTVIFILECFGAIAFALSGIVVSVEREMDPVGAFVVSFITAYGGGIIRDLLLGITPPAVFCPGQTRFSVILSVGIAMVVYLFAYFRKTSPLIGKIKNDMLFYILDAIGLSIFCVSGTTTAINAGYADNYLLVIACGVVSGCGGGVLRDIFTSRVPLVFRKHVYVLPALIGTIIYILLCGHMPQTPAAVIGILLIIGIRILAIRFKWNLPIPHGKESTK